MPATCKKLKGKWRLVEPDGSIITKNGSAVDGGGHDSQGRCLAQARAINATMAMSNFVFIPPPTWNAWELDQSDTDNLTYMKELIYEGTFRQSNGHEFIVNELLLDHWANTFVQMLTNGVEVPLPLKHTDDPEANRGKVLGMAVRRNSANVPALYAKVQFRDKDAAKLALTSQVSIFSPPEFTDGAGNRYIRPIRHVALTDYPVIPKLGGFESISASFYNPESMEGDMPLLDLTKKLGVDCDAEEKAEAAIVAAFQTQTTTIKERDETITARDAEIVELKKKIPTDPITVTASHRSMMKENRTLKLEQLVGEKISPAVRDTLLEIFCSDDQINLVLSHENTTDHFDKIIEALGKNEVVELGEKSGAQGGAKPLGKGKDGSTENPLLEDVERRKKEAAS